MSNFLAKLFRKSQPYNIHLITCIDTQRVFTSNVVQMMLETAGVDFEIREGDSSFEWDFFVRTPGEFEFAQAAMAEQGLWENQAELDFTFSPKGRMGLR